MIFAIDPGPKQSATCLFDGQKIEGKIWPNEGLLLHLRQHYYQNAAIEMIASYGMPVGAEVFETCLWIGKFMEAGNFSSRQLVYRKDVKMHLCGQTKAKDSNIRQALVDRFGPPGVKKSPGKTYGLKADMWAALAVAVTAYDKWMENHE